LPTIAGYGVRVGVEPGTSGGRKVLGLERYAKRPRSLSVQAGLQVSGKPQTIALLHVK
jgi:hypothetical protein